MRKFIQTVATHRLTYGRVDNIAELMGIPAAKFINTYQNDVNKMKLNLLKYAKALRTSQSHGNLPFGIGDDGRRQVVLQSTVDGYPILPIPLESNNWHKHDWENLFTSYIGWHYDKYSESFEIPALTDEIELAMGGKSSHHHMPKSRNGKVHL